MVALARALVHRSPRAEIGRNLGRRHAMLLQADRRALEARVVAAPERRGRLEPAALQPATRGRGLDRIENLAAVIYRRDRP